MQNHEAASHHQQRVRVVYTDYDLIDGDLQPIGDKTVQGEAWWFAHRNSLSVDSYAIPAADIVSIETLDKEEDDRSSFFDRIIHDVDDGDELAQVGWDPRWPDQVTLDNIADRMLHLAPEKAREIGEALLAAADRADAANRNG